MAVMNRQLPFQEHCKAFAARRGRFVVMHKDDDSSSSLRTPVASVAALFDILDVADDDENGDVGAAGIGDLRVPSIAAGPASLSTNPTTAVPPRAHGVPSTIVGATSSSTNPTKAVPPRAHGVPSTVVRAASSSTNPAHLLHQKAKALPGPKTYENDVHISLRLNIAKQLCCSGVHLITNAPLRKQGKVNMYQNNVLSPNGCMYGLTPYTCEDPYKKFLALLMRGVKYDAQQFEPDAAGDDHRTPLQTLQVLSHGILERMNTSEAAAKEKTAEAKRKAAKIKSANQALEVGLGLRTPTKRSSAPLLGVQPSARSHAHISVDVDLTSPSATVCPQLSTREIYFPCFYFICSSALTSCSVSIPSPTTSQAIPILSDLSMSAMRHVLQLQELVTSSLVKGRRRRPRGISITLRRWIKCLTACYTSQLNIRSR
jgi:hypothetical protein